MGGDALARVSPGDAIPHSAETWNAILEATRQFRAQGVGRRGGDRLGLDSMTPALTVDVRNDTGSTILEWSVIKLSTPLVLPTDFPNDAQDAPAFVGIAPTASTDLVAITHHGAATSETARATVSGLAVCKINVTDAAHTYASPTSTSVNYLLSGTTGNFPIIWKESGTGTKMAIVMMSQGIASGGSSGPYVDTATMSATIGATMPAGSSVSTGGFRTGGYIGITIGFGAVPTNAVLATVTYSAAFTTRPGLVILTPTSLAASNIAQSAQPWIDLNIGTTVSGFTIFTGNSGAISGTLQYGIAVVGGY